MAAGDLGLAVTAAEHLGDLYDVNLSELLAEVVTKMAPRMNRPQDAAVLAAVGLVLGEAAARREDYPAARRLAAVVRQATAASRNPTVVTRVRERLAR